MTTLAQMSEHCDQCGEPLESGQIGQCEGCQEEPAVELTNAQAIAAAKLAFETAKQRWLQETTTGAVSECLIESTDIRDALSDLGLPCTDCAESRVDVALSDESYFRQANELHEQLQLN